MANAPSQALRRPGGAVPIMLSAGLVVADGVTAVHRTLSLGLTATLTVLVVPWAFTVLRLSAQDFRARNVRRFPIWKLLGAHLLNVAVLTVCLYQKWRLALLSGDGDPVITPEYRVFTAVAGVALVVGLLGRGSRFGRLLLRLSDHPARLSALSFGVAALFGALLLTLPQALRDPYASSFIDGLFTAVSAVCVTGLVVHGTAETYSPFGQAVILGLIQIGGLGIMVMYSAFAILSGRRMRVRSSVAIAAIADARSLSKLRRTIFSIVSYTLIIELVGTCALYALFSRYPETALGAQSSAPLAGAGSRLWAAVFHSISAFCNAGFTVFHAGAEPFFSDFAVCLTLMVLIVLGGLGFPVLRELAKRAWRRVRGARPDRMSLHGRVVLITSAVMVGACAAMILLLDHGGALDGLVFHERILGAAFQSVTARTAGFNTLPVADLSAATLAALCLVMFIGASPGSTGGGVKTTTIAVLFATLRAELTGRPSPTLLDRSLARDTAQRAVGVLLLSIAIVVSLLLLLLAIERHEPLALAFEAFSAFATVGLSTGITGELSPSGRLLVALTMFVGRIGPMTLALALSARRTEGGPKLASEDLTIG